MSQHALLRIVEALFVLYVFAASVLSLADPACRERTLWLVLDGFSVGALLAVTRLVHHIRRSHHRGQSLFSWWCMARILFGHELLYGLVGGYLLGITHAFVACVAG